MGNLLFNCYKRKQEIRYRSTLLDTLNDPLNEPYSIHEIYLNSEIIDIQNKLTKIYNRLDLCENNNFNSMGGIEGGEGPYQPRHCALIHEKVSKW